MKTVYVVVDWSNHDILDVYNNKKKAEKDYALQLESDMCAVEKSHMAD